MRYAILAAASAAVAPVAQAAFGYTSSGGVWTVDAGSANSLVYKVNQASCDITSLVYIGVEVSIESSLSSFLDLIKYRSHSINTAPKPRTFHRVSVLLAPALRPLVSI